MVFPRLDPGSTVLVDLGKPCTERKPVKRRDVPMVKVGGMIKGGIVAIVEGEAYCALGLRGGLLGAQTQSHIGKIIISKLTYKLGGLLLLSPIGFRMEPQLGLYFRLSEMLGQRYLIIGLQTNVQVFVDFDYAMSRSITVYGLMILGCAGSLKANLQHMKALSITEAGYMTFTEAWKKEIFLKGLLAESGYKLSLVAGIATGAWVKGGSRSEVLAQVEGAAYRLSNPTHRLSTELRQAVRMRDRYIDEHKMSYSCDDILESVDIMRRMQLDDMEKASRLLLMARETQLKMHEKSMFVVKLRGRVVAATEDQRFARQINRLRGEMAVACEKRMGFVEELETVRGIITPAKAVEFLKDTQLKDDAKLAQLHDLERQVELRAVEKELFIQKLLRNVPF
ncbi:hypothetical protein Tco_1325490 [Tanacetum coccineum]